MRRIVLPGLAVVVLLVGYGFLSRSSGSEQKLTTARRDDLVLSAEIDGVLEAVSSIRLGPPQIPDVWDYKITMLADEGQEVSEGDPVIGFDTTELDRWRKELAAERDEAASLLDKRRAELDLRRADARFEIAQADAALRKARLTLDVPEDLVASRDLAKAELDLELAKKRVTMARERLDSLDDAARVELSAIESRRDRAQEKLDELVAAIDSMVVRAPRSGTVIYTNRGDDEWKVGDSCWRGSQVIELPDLEQMQATGAVEEVDAGRVSVGQHVRLRLDAHPDVEYRGRLKDIGRSVQQRSHDNPEKVVRVRVALKSTDRERMRPGMRFRGTIETGRLKRTLVIPLSSVRLTREGPVVLRWQLTGPQAVPVELGARNQTLVQVLAGLQEGDRIAVSPEPLSS